MSIHLTDHVTALHYGHVVQKTCKYFGMLVHVGIGWEFCWLTVISIHSYLLVKEGSLGRLYKPPKKLVIGVALFGWLAPIVWYAVIGMSVNAYDSSGYFCWVKDPPVCISFV
jgi:hypothetical protein